MKEGFDYDEWYREQALELAKLLMKALHVAATIGEVGELWEVIERKVKSLDLPDQPCYHCGKKIPYWNWALTQGYCEECVRKLAEEMERDEETRIRN